MSSFRAVILFSAVVFALIFTHAEEESGKENVGVGMTKSRTKYSREQKNKLKQVFNQSKTFYPADEFYVAVSHAYNVSVRQLRCWFQNRRQRYRKLNDSSVTKHFRSRYVFSKSELQHMMQVFKNTSGYPVKEAFKNMTENLGIEKMKLHQWFIDQRKKYKKIYNITKEANNAVIRVNGDNVTIRFKFAHLIAKDKENILEETFKQKIFPSKEDRQQLASRLQLSENAVNLWYSQRRKLYKEQGNEMPETRLFSADEEKVMKDEFNKTKYPNNDRRYSLSQRFNISYVQVNRWFYRARQKYRVTHNITDIKEHEALAFNTTTIAITTTQNVSDVDISNVDVQ